MGLKLLYNHNENDNGERPLRTGNPPPNQVIRVLCDMKGVAYHKVIYQNETVNANKNRLNWKYCTKFTENCKGLLLLDNNARPHIARVTQQKIMGLNLNVLPPHPSYSLDFTPIFSGNSNNFRGKYRLLIEVKTDIECLFASKPDKICNLGINNLPNRWDCAIDNKKYYLN